MKTFKKINKGLEQFLCLMNIIASASIFFIMLLITADVLSRLILNKPFEGTAEIVSSIIIFVTFFEIPYVSVKGAHVRTTMLYDKVGRNGKLIIDLIAALIGAIVYSLIILASWNNFTHAIQIGEAEIAGSFRISTIPGRFAVIFGSACMVLEFIAQIIRFSYELKSGKDFYDDKKGGTQK